MVSFGLAEQQLTRCVRIVCHRKFEAASNKIWSSLFKLSIVTGKTKTMRKTTKYPDPYTWSRFIADLVWLTVFITVFVKIAEAVTK